jgi:hypothetical protein
VITRQQNTTIASVAATTVSPTYAVPVTTPENPFPWKPVANMQASIKPQSSVQITFSAQISTPAPSSARFVIYRDGGRISQEYRQYTAGDTTVPSILSGTYVDENPTPNQIHSYHLYVLPVDQPVTFSQLGRVFQVLDQKAQ